jgi:hypothetical protein
LKDAPIPTEAGNFEKKQRELFAARRKNQADALDFLHQFRADDEFVLRTARRSLGSKHSSASRYSLSPRKLEPGRQPDARAAVHTYAVYPILTQTTIQNDNLQQDCVSDESSSLQSPINPPDIIEDSICFKSALEALALAAKEASRHPLPEDTESENDNHAIGSLLFVIEDRDQTSLPDDNNGCVENDDNGHPSSLTSVDEATKTSLPASNRNSGCSHNEERDIVAAEVESEDVDSTLILDGEVDDGNVTSSESDSNFASELSATPFIPYEAFSKLGESLVMESHIISRFEHNDTESVAKDDSDDDSIIPGESFMQLGASMMANDLSSSRDDDEEKDVVAKESEQDLKESSDTTRGTTTDGTASQASTGLKSLSAGAEITESASDEIPDDNLGESVMNEHFADFENCAGDDMFDLITTPKKSNRTIVTRHDNQDSSCVDRISHEEEKPVESEMQPKVDEEQKLEESEMQPKVDGDIANEHPTGDAPRSLPRNKTKKKKKKKDAFYYPSSSLFVSRQYLSR